MASLPIKFLFSFFLLLVIGWVVFIFAARLLAWLLSRIMGASVEFRVAGWNCLSDVIVKFNKGAVESVFAGEIKLSLHRSLVKFGDGFICRDPKLQLLICDLEVVIRPSKKSVKKATPRKPRSAGRGKWLIVANMARFLSVSMTGLVIKVPKVTTEIKDLRVDVSKDGGSKSSLFVKLHLLHFLAQMDESQLNYDQASNFNQGGCISSGQAFLVMKERGSAPFICAELSLSCEFGHDREVGFISRSVDVTSGEVNVNLNEDLFLKNKTESEAFIQAATVGGDYLDPEATRRPQKKQNAILSLKKYVSLFPEKVSFNLPKLDVTFVHRGQDLVVENNVMGIHLRSSKSQSNDDTGESTRVDVQMGFSEFHLLREAGSSVLEILKLAVVSSLYIPIQPISPIRAEIDVKLGCTLCNIIMSRLKPLMCLHLSKKKKMVLRKENSNIERSQTTEIKAFMWTCNVSAPEMTILLYNLNGKSLYRGCSQSSHVFANNVAPTGIAVHMELSEFHLHVVDEHQECLKENLFGLETNPSSLMHVGKVTLDLGKKEVDSLDEHDPGWSKLVLSIDVSGIGVYFSFQRVESLISTAMPFQALLKSLSATSKRTTQNRGAPSTKPSGKGIQFLKLNLEQCSMSFYGDVGVEDTVVSDPKCVNYGSQGGRVIINVSADGSPRMANITSTMLNGSKHLRYSVSLDIFHFRLNINKGKQSTEMELERASSIYQEYLEEHRLDTKVTLLDMKNAKFVRRSGGPNDISICSLFSATEISVRWVPDVHLSIYELMLQLKLLIHNMKLRVPASEIKEEFSTEKILELEKKVKGIKRESIIAIDVELLSISAELGDGVDAIVQIQSIFSENARIGILLEGLMLSFNEARVFKSTRMQISRIPNVANTWDWVIQGLDVHICMPYRLQLRAIEDSIEDMFRGLKLIMAAKTSLTFPKKESCNSKKKPKSTKLGRVKFCIRNLTAYIEEEPMQGWLDEHYHLMRNEACELAVRLKFLDDLVSEDNQSSGSVEPNESCSETKVHHNGVEIDVHDTSAIQKLREEIYKQSFQCYYQACQNLKAAEGSGACKRDFQAGFKPSTGRTSLLSVCGTELDVTLTKIEGDETGMIEIIKKLDPVCLVNEIPFSRLLGREIVLNAGSLIAKLRNYSFPLFSATAGKCQGRVVLAQQATCFQPQIQQDVFIGKWRKVCMLRSLSGTTPPLKTYSDLPIHFQKGEVCFGVGFEPSFADISYAFTVALRRANLSVRNVVSDPNNPYASGVSQVVQPPKKERSLPWWDEVRNYIHGNNSLYFAETRWNILGTTDPYEKHDKLQIFSNYMEILQSDGRVSVSVKDFKILLSSLESLVNNGSLKLPNVVPDAFLEVPAFGLEVTMEWECDSGNPLNHYLYALPNEGEPRKKVYDPFRSTSLSLRWNFSFRPSSPHLAAVFDALLNESKNLPIDSPTMNVGAHDLAWLINFWNMNYNPPHKLRSFSRWPRFGVPRVARSGNLSLDKVMTEFMLRLDSMPTCMKHTHLDDDDPACGLTFRMERFKYELCFGRGRQKYTFDCIRDPLDLVYQGLDLHMLKAYLNKEGCTCVAKEVQMEKKNSQFLSANRDGNEKGSNMDNCIAKHCDDGFLLSSVYINIRRQAPKADPTRILQWQEVGRRNLEMTHANSEFENWSEGDDHSLSDPSDDDGFNVVVADNCLRVCIYGFKILWTIESRDAVWSWVGGISKAFEPPNPSPSWQYAQRKLLQDSKEASGTEMVQDDTTRPLPSIIQSTTSLSPEHLDTSECHSSPSHLAKMESSSAVTVAKNGTVEDSDGEGTRQFMVNVIQPQFNLHSEEANGRFLLAAASGRVLARSFHTVLHVGHEMIEQTLGTESINIPESEPEMTWKRAELSVMLEHVQAHVAPTDVDPGAGLQWLPKILRSSPKVKRTGALLEQVFMPCTMYFRYTRHKSGTTDLKVKPLKELAFNSPNITAAMTSRQFQVMLDVLTNLLFARLPKPRRSSLSYLADNDEGVEEEDEVVPDGVEEIELARIDLEANEREWKLILDDIRNLSINNDASQDLCEPPEDGGNLWMITGGRSTLVQGLKKEMTNTLKARKVAYASLRMAVQKAAQLRLMEKEKNKSPSCAMRISLRINKVVWSMLADGKSFAEVEINDMIYDFDRDYKDIGIAKFTTKFLVARNCLPNAKSDMLLSAWNPPSEWGKNVMLRVDAKQGAPKDGNSPLELFQVDIYPLKIHLTETMYRMIWGYFFPEEEQDSQRRKEVWKVSTTAGAKRAKKGSSVHEVVTSSNHSLKESEVPSKSIAFSGPLISSGASRSSTLEDASQVSKLQNLKANIISGSTPGLRRTSSFDRTWEENIAESIASELVFHVHSSSISSSTSGPLSSAPEHQEESSRNKSKDSKLVKSGRPSHEEKKIGKSHDEKRERTRKMREFQNIKISQVELLLTYEGSRFVVSDMRLLMDTFHRAEFTGTWSRLFSRVKKHIIWGVLKSVTGMQGKKFKYKAHTQKEPIGIGIPASDVNFSDSDEGQAVNSDLYPISWPKRPSDGAGDRFVTSIRGLFNSQRRKAKAFVLRTMRGEEDDEFHGEWSESDVEFSPFARQLTITKAKKLIRQHTKKLNSRRKKGKTSQHKESLPSSSKEDTQSDYSSGSSLDEDFHE